MARKSTFGVPRAMLTWVVFAAWCTSCVFGVPQVLGANPHVPSSYLSPIEQKLETNYMKRLQNSGGAPSLLDSNFGTKIDIMGSYPTQEDPGYMKSIASADLDGDGDDDLVIGTNEGLYWLKRQGKDFPYFGERVGIDVCRDDCPEHWNSVAVADLNEDGHLDVVAASADLVWYENGGNASSWSSPRVIESGPAYGVEVALLDDDPYFDVVSKINQTIRLFKTEGKVAEFNDYEVLVNANVDCDRFQVADLNTDGVNDIVCSSSSAGEIVWAYSTIAPGMSPSWSEGTVAKLHDVTDVVVGDFDLDGLVDVAACKSSGSLSWFSFGGDLRTAQPWTQHFITEEFQFRANRLEAADFDNDGDLDVITERGGSAIVLFENRGDGSFSTAVELESVGNDSFRYDYAVKQFLPTDVNSDGALDVLFISEWRSFSEEYSLSLFLNDLDDCVRTPCQDGECIDDRNFAVCYCEGGFRGNLCDEAIARTGNSTIVLATDSGQCQCVTEAGQQNSALMSEATCTLFSCIIAIVVFQM